MLLQTGTQENVNIPGYIAAPWPLSLLVVQQTISDNQQMFRKVLINNFKQGIVKPLDTKQTMETHSNGILVKPSHRALLQKFMYH